MQYQGFAVLILQIGPDHRLGRTLEGIGLSLALTRHLGNRRHPRRQEEFSSVCGLGLVSFENEFFILHGKRYGENKNDSIRSRDSCFVLTQLRSFLHYDILGICGSS